MLGSYWMSSNSSVRSTTAPGVTARSSPTVNAFVSTIAGMCGGLRRSWTRLALPCTRLRPPVSSVAFSAAGLSAGKFVGASASRTFSALKRTRRSARSSSPASEIRSSTVLPAARYTWASRRNAGFPLHASSLKRRSFFDGATSDWPMVILASSAP